MHRLSLIFITIALPLAIRAQTVRGKLVDGTNQPLPYANVVLLSIPDSVFVSGTVSGEDGTFSLNATSQNQLIRISSIGYITVYKPIIPTDMGVIKLDSDMQQLGEITVKGSRPVTQMRGDAMVTHVVNSVLSKVGSAEEVLLKLPGVTKKEDTYEVFGKGAPLIYINGRKLNDLKELEQLNADEIKEVEVIRNPGSRYDATVKAVIKIQTLKRQGDGFGFDVRSSYYQSKNTRIIEQANFNYRHRDWDLFGMLYYGRTERERDYTAVLEKRGTQVWNHDISSVISALFNDVEVQLGFNYQISDQHSIGARYNLSQMPTMEIESETWTDINVDGKKYDFIHSEASDEYDSDLGHDVNVYYNGRIGRVGIDFNANYFQNGGRTTSNVKEMSENFEARDVHSVGDVRNRLAAGKLVVSFPFGKGTWSMGSEFTYTHRNDDYLNEENYVPTSYSKVEEINATGFVDYKVGFPWGDWSLGVRYEHVKFDYFEDGIHIDGQSRIFDNLFPNLSFSTQIGKVQTQLTYTAKTVRPSYSQLTNNVTYVDRYTQTVGSPTLCPTLVHDVSWSAAWKWMNISISYSRTKDWILYWGDLVEADASIAMLNYRNWDKPIPAFTTLLSVSPKIGCWTLMLGVGIQKQWLTVDSFGEPFDMDSPVYTANLNNMFELPKGFLVGLDANIRSKGAYQNFYMEHASGSVDISVRKSFLNDALTVELKGTDLFDTDRDYNHLYSGNYNFYQKTCNDKRKFSMTLRYKFNSAKSKYKGTGAGESQKNRM